ncbi:DUF2306 domain-containing protein [Winogradskyella sp. PG-2]|uniref:DUF2306 domain-containing protein n=1 Tax=Winogradskyella sp. PG-2 TaxID=754409 RepID=UPI0004588785|nr:DUF2306 domain-containing protein [Winogradskyella sp. PG-2]BAO76948.1 membrane protein, putative [Winogradskyella sp. PG-2]
MNSNIKKVGFYFFGLLCVAVGLYPIIYFVLDRRFGLLGSKTADLLTNTFWNIGFYGHIILGGLALLIGWLQFNKNLRSKNLKLHKRIGKLYVITVLISGFCGLYIAFFATGGLISKLGFMSLALIWLYSTIQGYRFAKNAEIIKHQYMMIYSYAACFAAVTLRIWLPILGELFGAFIPAYRIVAWLCWMPNIIVAFFIVNNLKKKSLSV